MSPKTLFSVGTTAIRICNVFVCIDSTVVIGRSGTSLTTADRKHVRVLSSLFLDISATTALTSSPDRAKKVMGTLTKTCVITPEMGNLFESCLDNLLL